MWTIFRGFPLVFQEDKIKKSQRKTLFLGLKSYINTLNNIKYNFIYFIQTILSVPEFHRFSLSARGLYRRSGNAPCPEDVLSLCVHYNSVTWALQFFFSVLEYYVGICRECIWPPASVEATSPPMTRPLWTKSVARYVPAASGWFLIS